MTRAIPTCPYLFAVPATAMVVALASTALSLGAAGVIGGAILGLAWSILLGGVIERLVRCGRWSNWLANASIGLGIAATGAMVGGGAMYILLMNAAAAAPSAVLSAMMQPTIPFFIVLNTPLELLIVPGAVFTNWQNEKRRALILLAATEYYVLRFWTYLFYAPQRLAIASRPLSPEDLDWFQRTLSVDYRLILVALVQLAFIAAAFVPAPPGAPARQAPLPSPSPGKEASQCARL